MKSKVISLKDVRRRKRIKKNLIKENYSSIKASSDIDLDSIFNEIKNEELNKRKHRVRRN
jgi:hypothetical protein